MPAARPSMMAFWGSMPAATASRAASVAASSSPSMTARLSRSRMDASSAMDASLTPSLVLAELSTRRYHLAHVHRRGLGGHLATGHERETSRMVLALFDAGLA